MQAQPPDDSKSVFVLLKHLAVIILGLVAISESLTTNVAMISEHVPQVHLLDPWHPFVAIFVVVGAGLAMAHSRWI
jgi:hypothetical protein